jgi:hypothetical protein
LSGSDCDAAQNSFLSRERNCEVVSSSRRVSECRHSSWEESAGVCEDIDHTSGKFWLQRMVVCITALDDDLPGATPTTHCFSIIELMLFSSRPLQSAAVNEWP